MTTILLIALIALPVVLALLPATSILAATARPAAARIVLVLAAAVVACVGCSQQTEPPKPRPIHWSSPETGYNAETPPPKEGQ